MKRCSLSMIVSAATSTRTCATWQHRTTASCPPSARECQRDARSAHAAARGIARGDEGEPMTAAVAFLAGCRLSGLPRRRLWPIQISPLYLLRISPDVRPNEAVPPRLKASPCRFAKARPLYVHVNFGRPLPRDFTVAVFVTSKRTFAAAGIEKLDVYRIASRYARGSGSVGPDHCSSGGSQQIEIEL